MIVDVKGTKLVFGMVWRPIVGNGPPAIEASKIAKGLKSDRIWHEGRTPLVGVATGSDAAAKLKDGLYAGAIALAHGPSKGLSMLFVYHLPASQGSAAQYIVCGIVKGRPKAEFDAVVASEQAVAERVARYARVCVGSFTLAGNVDGLRALVDPDRQVDVVPLELAAIASAADKTASLRAAKIGGLSPAWVFRGGCVVIVVFLARGTIGKYLPDLPLPFLHHKAPQKTPQQLYDASLAAGMQSAAMPAAALGAWDAWWGAQPFVVGGWVQSSVACKASALPLSCVFTYTPYSSAATNLTFAQAKPTSWPTPHYANNGKKITITLRCPVVKPARLSIVTKTVPTVNDLALNFASSIQQIARISERANVSQPQPYLVPLGVEASSISHALYASTWQVDGPLRNVDLLASLPAYATVTTIELNVNLQAKPKFNQSKLTLNVSGMAFARK